MSNPELRKKIIAYMQKESGACCTWWFKSYIHHETKSVRRELEKMERDGLVTADRSQTNNTKWTLAEVPK